MLGLDRLASEKRAAAASETVDGRRKRPRIDDGAEPYFKGKLFASSFLDIPLKFFSSTKHTRLSGE